MADTATGYDELLARAAPFLTRRPAPPAAGYGRVAVAGDVWLRAAAEPYLLDGLPELPLDADAMVDALVTALNELDVELAAAETRAVWDPAKHPRGPGGRFRSTVDSLKEAIVKHRQGGGKGHPFDGFDRKQLMRAAKDRGITLRRGEDRDSIAAKLLADLGPGKPGKAGGRARPRSVLVRGQDRLDEVEAHYRRNPVEYMGRRRAAYDSPYDQELALITTMQGFDAKPQVGTRGDVDAAVAAGWTETWRGVGGGMYGEGVSKSAAQINRDLRSGPWEPGRGIYGNGMYTSVRRGTAETYRGRDPKTNFPSGSGPDFGPEDFTGDAAPDSMLRIAIDPAAKVGDFDELRDEMGAWIRTLPEGNPARVALVDVGRYAAGRGFDVVIVRGHSDGAFYPGFETDIVDAEDVGNFPQADQFVILNRSAIMIQRAEDVP